MQQLERLHGAVVDGHARFNPVGAEGREDDAQVAHGRALAGGVERGQVERCVPDFHDYLG